MFLFLSIPVLCLALVAGAVVGSRLSEGPRRVSLVAAILLACVLFAAVRTNGMSGSGRSDLAWRWSKTHEEQLVAQPGSQLPAAPARVAAMPAAAPAKIPEERPVVHKAKDRPVELAPTPAAAEGQVPTGLAFADRAATAAFPEYASKPTGRHHRRSSCGAGKSDRAGHPSRSAATFSIHRSSEATTSSSPATTRLPASRFGHTTT